MKLAVMQPYFFPYLGQFQLISAADEYVVYDQVQYIKKGWIDRNQLIANYGEQRVYIRPVLKKPSTSGFLISEVKISSSDQWRRKLTKYIWHTYRRAAHFEEIYPFLEALINFRPENLSEFNFYAIQKICDLLRIETKILFNPPEFLEVERDLEKLVNDYQKSDPLLDRRQVRVIEFCKKRRSSHFINSIGGLHLYKRAAFKRQGLDLSLIKCKSITYSQFKQSDFVANLSIIDVLLHNGVERTIELLSEYEYDLRIT